MTTKEPPDRPDDNALIAERRAKLARLRASGPAYPNDFRRDALAADLRATWGGRSDEWLTANPVRVRVAGRMMFKRVMGKASFAKLQDSSGQIQVYLQSEALAAGYEEFKGWDVGDIVATTGVLMRTRAGELSVRAESARLLVKALRPLPDKWHGLADTEMRYRQRYVDLIVNEKARETFRARTRVVRFLRDFLDALGFLEVETPMMQPLQLAQGRLEIAVELLHVGVGRLPVGKFAKLLDLRLGHDESPFALLELLVEFLPPLL